MYNFTTRNFRQVVADTKHDEKKIEAILTTEFDKKISLYGSFASLKKQAETLFRLKKQAEKYGL